jgi:hypothetical protein
MVRRARVVPLLLLLAAMAGPVAGVPRSLDSLRLVVSIAWFSESDTVDEPRADAEASRPAWQAAAAPLDRPDPYPHSSEVPRARFQRPPPHLAVV